ncbi:MAG: hypothetical protein ACFFD7_14970 [Candidatus Thorarchaeota archaeon]
MKEKICPICSKIVRSDANIIEFCTLCGMGIPEHLLAPIFEDDNGNIFYFCCSRCLSIYKTDIIRKQKPKLKTYSKEKGS